MWYFYLLKCSDGSLYAGATTDTKRRVRQHNAGKGGAYTRSRVPVKLIYRESYPDRSTAFRREAEVKRLSRPEKLVLAKRGRDH